MSSNLHCSSLTPNKPYIQDLPLDLLFYLKDFLDTADQGLLSFTCKHFSLVYNDSWRKLKCDPDQQLSFLVHLDRTLPGSRFCSGCAKYHPRSSSSEWLTTQSHTTCGEPNVPLIDGYYIYWPQLYLALRRYNYRSLDYGCSFSTFPTELPDTHDVLEGLTWQHSLSWWSQDGRLLIAICSYREWYGHSRTLSQQVRGCSITVESHKGRLHLCVRRVIDAAAVKCWGNVASPGWSPSKDKTWRWYNESTGCYDPDAGLPGLHWTELSAARKAHGVPEWSAWRWCPKTGLPYNIQPRIPGEK